MAEVWELSEAVRLVRNDLLRAATDGADQDIRFEVGPIGMEFTVELRRDARAKVGFRVWVVSADADAGASLARTHKVTLTLTPRHADGRPVEIFEEEARPGGASDGSLFRPPGG
ncbi:hypothetical protein OHS59_04420 [Streptomyces sp. NBC_00414]|uniref:trypco2 family protein n=1 Tax=Streptomyces sp. NBC_00414 TaxID=2975739 RepID=UPI002E2131A1